MAHVLFNSSMTTLYSGRRDATTCSRALPLNLKKPNAVKLYSELLKKQHLQRSPDVPTPETKRKTEFFVNKDDRSKTRETIEIKQNLKKPDVCKSVPATSRPPQIKKQPPLKVSQNPKSGAHKLGETKQNLKKQPSVKKNSTEMLELFEIAKKTADMANAKGLLAAQAETSICVDTLSLLMEYPISSTATETRRIMMRLEHLTKHKDRKICKSASTLLHYWRQSIRDQECRESPLKSRLMSLGF